MSNIATTEKTRYLVPACSITEADGTVVLRVELPGIPKENIEVQVEQEGLTIVGKSDAHDENGTYLIRERRTGDFRKVFTLDETVDREKIDAVYTNGVMTLTMQLKEAVKPRRIQISSR